MVSIIRFDNSCKIIEDDEGTLKLLDNELSFKIQGSEFSQAYQGYTNEAGEFVTWDGRKHLLTGSGKFPVGLLSKVQEFYALRNQWVEIIDKRTKKTPLTPVDISDNLLKLGKTTRPYQELAVEAALKTDRGVIKAPTGAGKTLIASLLISKIGKSALVLVIGKDLLYQFQDLLEKVFQEDVGIIGDGKCEIKEINVATIWSVGQALGLKKNNSLDDTSDKEKKIDSSKFSQIKGMLLNTKTIILDECNMAACDTVQTISRNIKAEYVYGMSASPWRDDGQDMLIDAFLGPRIFDISARELIKSGYLVEPDIRFLAPVPYKFKSGQYKTIYSKYIVENEQRNSMVVKGTLKMVEQGFVPLVLFNTIKHGDILYDELRDKTSVALLSGKDSSSTREKIKDQLEDGKLKCVIASRIFDIGVDLPILSGLIAAGAGKSSVRALQRIGRVIRPYEGKDRAVVLDFADGAPYLSKHAEIRSKIYQTEFNVKMPK